MRMLCAFVLLLPVWGADHKAILGTWQGQLHDLPAVTLTLKSAGEGVEGTAVFYIIRDVDGRKSTGGKSEASVLNGRFDGKALNFDVKNGARVIPFEMKIVGDGVGELSEAGPDEQQIVVKMAREKAP